MMTGTITDDQARALAQLVAALRPGWDVAGIRAAISRARHRAPAHELAIAAIRCTQGDARTPEVITLDGPHWHTPGAATAPSKVERCPEPGHGSYYAWNCGACHADRIAAETDQANNLIRAGVPRDRVRQILADHGVTRPDPRAAAAGDKTPHYRED